MIFGTYYTIIKKFSRKEQLIGIEVQFQGEKFLLRDHDRRLKLHKINSKGTGYLSTGRAAKNEEYLLVLSEPEKILSEEARKIEYKKRIQY